MKRVFSFAMFSVLISAIGVFANDSAKSKDPHELVQATYMITGLHCPACTRTVESSLGHVDGIRSVKVDWKTKNAQDRVRRVHTSGTESSTPHCRHAPHDG